MSYFSHEVCHGLFDLYLGMKGRKKGVGAVRGKVGWVVGGWGGGGMFSLYGHTWLKLLHVHCVAICLPNGHLILVY